jgi:hypothetical protein
MPHQSHDPWLDHPNNILWSVQGNEHRYKNIGLLYNGFQSSFKKIVTTDHMKTPQNEPKHFGRTMARTSTDEYFGLQKWMLMKSRRITWAGHVVCMRQLRNAYKILILKSEGRMLFRKAQSRWEDNIKIYLKEVDSSDSGQCPLTLAFMSTVMNLWVP